jgi:peptide/nickel transport system permease protein
MIRLVARRLVATIPVLFLVTLGVFLLIHLVPGDPVEVMLGESQDPLARETLRHDLGFDQPVYIQYANWLIRVAQGDLGRSVRTHQTVLEDVSQRIRPTLELAVYAMLIATLVAVPLGILTATHRNSALDSFGTSFALFGICMPNFVLALLLIFVFGVTLHWLPIASFTDPFDNPIAGIKSLTLPAITLGLALAAVITRTLRSSLLESLSEEYIKTARAKGLDSAAVVLRHALKNALIPVVTVIGLQFGTLIGGAVITEYVFAIPGVGRLVVDSIFARDYPLVQGVVLLICIGFIVSNLVVDILYGWLDPRIRSTA